MATSLEGIAVQRVFLSVGDQRFEIDQVLSHHVRLGISELVRAEKPQANLLLGMCIATRTRSPLPLLDRHLEAI